MEINEQNSLPSGEAEDEVHPMDALLEDEAYLLETPRQGEIRTGTVARITESDILVDIGAKSEGIIPGDELQKLSEDRREAVKVGADVTVYVVRAGRRDGMIQLSIVKAEEEEDWNRAERLLESEDNFDGEVSGYNKGGLLVKLGHLRGFVPGSQVSLSRRRRAQGSTPDQRWGKMVGEPIVAKVIEVDRKRNRLILSERAATREARDVLKERLIDELKPGEIRSGHVISLADFGAFVDIGGADGLVHTSEISWKRINHPSEVLEVGQKVEVKILDLDPERKRISLSLRELEDDPWDEIAAKFQEGQLVEGVVTKITKFGAFARLEESQEYEVEGLIHISELSEQRIEHPSEVVHEGDRLTLRIIKVEPDRRRIGLSLRKVDSTEFADMDWQQAMQEIDDEGDEVEDEIVDFDADLESELEGEFEEPPEADMEAAEDEGSVEMEAEIDQEMDEEPAGDPEADVTEEGETEQLTPEADDEPLEEPDEAGGGLESPTA